MPACAPRAAAGGSAPTATVHVTLRVAPKRPGGRGQVRASERVEREVLAGFDRTPTRDGATVLQLPFEEMKVAIAMTAEQHRCSSESEAWTVVARERWSSTMALGLRPGA